MSNALTALNAGLLTMTSLEIAERTGKTHAHVMRDIRNMLAELGVTEASFGSSYRDSTGRTLPCFRLPKRESLILVSGYSVPLRAAIVDRWAELEAAAAAARPALPDFSDPGASARAWADEYDAKKLAQAEVARLAPVAAVGALVCSHESSLVRFVQSALPSVNSQQNPSALLYRYSIYLS